MKKMLYMIIAAVLLCEAAAAQTLGRIEIHNNTGYRLNYGIWSHDSWKSFAVDPAYKHIFSDSGNLVFLVETSNGETTIGTRQYQLLPGNTYEFVINNGVWDLTDKQQYFPTHLAPHIVQNDDGSYRPGPAYVWDDPDDANNFEVALRTGLTTLPNGTLVPAPGYDWLFPYDANDPGNRRNFYVWQPPSHADTARGAHDYGGGSHGSAAADRSPASDPVTMGTADMIHAMLPDAIKAIQDHNAALDEAVDHINNSKGGNGGGKSEGGGKGAGNSSNSGGNSNAGNKGGGEHHGSGDTKH